MSVPLNSIPILLPVTDSHLSGSSQITTYSQARASMNDVHLKVSNILEDDYVDNVQSLSTGRLRCLKISNNATVFSFVFMALSTILSFSAGFFGVTWLGFLAGSCSTCAMVCGKLTSFANGQSQYQEGSLKNLLTSGFQFLKKFASNPSSILVQPAPPIPDFDNAIQSNVNINQPNPNLTPVQSLAPNNV